MKLKSFSLCLLFSIFFQNIMQSAYQSNNELFFMEQESNFTENKSFDIPPKTTSPLVTTLLLTSFRTTSPWKINSPQNSTSTADATPTQGLTPIRPLLQ